MRRLIGFVASAYRDRVFFLAAALSLNAILAAVPLAMLVLALLGYVLEPYQRAGDLGMILRLVLPADVILGERTLARAEQLFTSVVASRRQLSLYGLPLFLFFSTRLFRATRVALDQVLGASSRRRWFFGIARDLVLVIVATVLTAGVALATLFPLGGSSPLRDVMHHALALALSAMLFYVIYGVAPARKLSRDTVVKAAFIAALAFEAARILYGVYVAELLTVGAVITHTNALAVLVSILWVYCGAVILLLGSEFAKAREQRAPA